MVIAGWNKKRLGTVSKNILLEDLDPFKTALDCLIHLSLATYLWDIRKQCRPKAGAAECNVCSGSTLFAYSMLCKNFK